MAWGHARSSTTARNPRVRPARVGGLPAIRSSDPRRPADRRGDVPGRTVRDVVRAPAGRRRQALGRDRVPRRRWPAAARQGGPATTSAPRPVVRAAPGSRVTRSARGGTSICGPAVRRGARSAPTIRVQSAPTTTCCSSTRPATGWKPGEDHVQELAGPLIRGTAGRSARASRQGPVATTTNDNRITR